MKPALVRFKYPIYSTFIFLHFLYFITPFIYSLLCSPPKLRRNKSVSRVKACVTNFFFFFLRWTIFALHPWFVINAPEKYATLPPAQQQGQIYRKLLLAAWRDKAGDSVTSILACGIVQTCVDNAIIYLGIQYLRKYALWTPRIFVILPIWTSTWIIFLSRTSPNKRGFQSYNKRCFSFKGSYLGFIALKEIQIRFATVPILNRVGAMEGGRGGSRGCCAELPRDGSRGPHLASCSFFFSANVQTVQLRHLVPAPQTTAATLDPDCSHERVFFLSF